MGLSTIFKPSGGSPPPRRPQRALLKELLRPYPADEMVSHPVSPLVNRPGNRGAELIAEAPLNSA